MSTVMLIQIIVKLLKAKITEQVLKAEREKKLIIDAVIVCSKESHKGIIIGRGGQMLQKINQQASKDISEMVGKRVYLSLFVKVEEDWLNKSNKLFDLGYLQKNNED